MTTTALTPTAPESHAPTQHGGHVDHFESPAARRDACLLGMWVFIAQEVMFFGGLFTVYAVYRFLYHDAFVAGSRDLNLELGTFNTFALLTSSLTMALAVNAAENDDMKKSRLFLIVTALLGTLFLVIKAIEYYHKYEHQALPAFDLPWANHGVHDQGVKLFISIYLAMTGLHALHMVIGIGLLAYFIWQVGKPHFWNHRSSSIDVLGLYWHLVDLVWIFLFPLLYLIDRS